MQVARDELQKEDARRLCCILLAGGDNLKEDYLAARAAGLQAALIESHHTDSSGDKGVHSCSSILDVVELVKQSWRNE